MKSTNDEIERLKKLVDLLLERLEEQNDAEQQQAQLQAAHGQVASGSGSGAASAADVGVHDSAAALVDPTAIATDTPAAVAAASNPYQAHFGAYPCEQESSGHPRFLPHSTFCSSPIHADSLHLYPHAAMVQADASLSKGAGAAGGGASSDIRVVAENGSGSVSSSSMSAGSSSLSSAH